MGVFKLKKILLIGGPILLLIVSIGYFFIPQKEKLSAPKENMQLQRKIKFYAPNYQAEFTKLLSEHISTERLEEVKRKEESDLLLVPGDENVIREIRYLLVHHSRFHGINLGSLEIRNMMNGKGERTVFALEQDKENLRSMFEKEKIVFLSDKEQLVSKISESGNNLAIISLKDKDIHSRVVHIDGINPLLDETKNPFILRLSLGINNPEYKYLVRKMTTGQERVVPIRVKSVGDIMLSRFVLTKMKKNGWCSPFEKVKGWLKDAEITTGNIENGISDKLAPSSNPNTMSFVTPSSALCGVKESGMDVISLANNHSLNYGPQAVVDSIDALNNAGILPVGAGKNYTEAHQSKIVERFGKKFAFLGYNTISGGYSATPDKAGLAHINAAPFFPYSQEHVNVMIEDIKRAKKDNTAVILIFHWGREYSRSILPDQRKIAYSAIDAGADLVVGIHAHWVAGHEIYKNKLITYSLGNFVFDQGWSRDTEEGVGLETIFYEGKIIDYSFTPFVIKNWYQPDFADGPRALKILSDVGSK